MTIINCIVSNLPMNIRNRTNISVLFLYFNIRRAIKALDIVIRRLLQVAK